MRGFKFTLEDVGRILSWAYRRFYLRPKYIARNIFNGSLKTIIEVIWRAIKSYLSRSSEENNLCNDEGLKEIEEVIQKG